MYSTCNRMMVTLKNDRVIIMMNRIVHFKKDTVTKTLSFRYSMQCSTTENLLIHKEYYNE